MPGRQLFCPSSSTAACTKLWNSRKPTRPTLFAAGCSSLQGVSDLCWLEEDKFRLQAWEVLDWKLVLPYCILLSLEGFKHIVNALANLRAYELIYTAFTSKVVVEFATQQLILVVLACW